MFDRIAGVTVKPVANAIGEVSSLKVNVKQGDDIFETIGNHIRAIPEIPQIAATYTFHGIVGAVNGLKDGMENGISGTASDNDVDD